jgi:adenylate kinase
MRLILLGAPGAGKGTQSKVIADAYKIPEISTGEILRAAIREESELGKLAKQCMDAGTLVPDEVVIALVRDYLGAERCRKGFILDGFPRSIPQAEALDAAGTKIDVVLELKLDDEIIVNRMSGRRVCPGCGASYNVVGMPPKTEGVCDRCGTALLTREDDKPEIVRKRLEVYHAQTEPLSAYYEQKGLLVRVDASGSFEENCTRVLNALIKKVGSK